jgi:hypothetical protein
MAQQTESVTKGHKLTAVEWLIKRYQDYGTLYYEDMTQAKEMEKEQTLNSYIDGAEEAKKNI